MLSIISTLRNTAARSRVVLASADGQLSAEDLDVWSNQIAAQVEAFGCAQDRTIGVLAPSSLEYAAAMTGIWKAGAMAVPLQPEHPKAELEYLIQDAGLSEVFFHERARPLAEHLAATARIRIFQISRQTVPSAPTRSAPQENHGALMIYTSGTTNRPKGVVTTYGALESQIRTLQEAWAWTDSDRTLNVLPLHHVHGIVNILCCSLATGAFCELAEKFDPDLVWGRIASEKEAISVFMAVPTIYSKLIEHYDKQDGRIQRQWSMASRRLRLMVSGSAALPGTVFARWESMTGHRLLERYGMTETGMILSNPYFGERRPGSVGMPLPGVDVRLVNEAGQVVSAHSIPAEVQVRGPMVFREYWKKPEPTKQSFTADGWFRTGDVAQLDSQGYYILLGRISQDIIKSGGYKISALEIESVLLEHPDFAEVAVVGVPDETWGEKIAAAVVLKSQAKFDSDAYAKHVKSRLAHYKVPILWKQTHGLPRNAMGKVVKSSVRALFNSAD
jgi:malonyl-CoA/methylmalonyl-CoA synthetase